MSQPFIWSSILMLPYKDYTIYWGFPGASVAMTSHSQWRGPGFDSWSCQNWDLVQSNKWVKIFDFPGGSDSKASAYNARDLGSVPGSGRSLEKEMATHSSILAWRIPWTEEPGRLQPTGLQRVGHNWATSFHFTSLYVIRKQLDPCEFCS